MKRLVVFGVLLLSLIWVGGAASGEAVFSGDKVGDAAKGVDLASVGVTNKPRVVVVHVGFAHPLLAHRRIDTVRVQVDVGKPFHYGYFIDAPKFRGPLWPALHWAPMFSEFTSRVIPCPALAAHWGEDLDVVLPRTCMTHKHDSRVRVSVSVIGKHGGLDSAPNPPRFFTAWARRG